MSSIKKKLLTSFFTIISILLISEAFFIATDYMILSKYMALTSNMISEYKLIGNTSALLFSFDKRIKSPLDISEINNYNSIYANIKTSLAKLNNSITGYDSKIAFIGLENNINDVLLNLEIGVGNLNRGDYLEAVNYHDAAHEKNNFIKENSTNLLLKELEYAKNLQTEIDKVRALSQLIAIFLLIMTVGGCAWYAIVFSKRLISPLLNLTKLAKVIEDGNLDAAVDTSLLKENNEVGSLANSFNTMVLSLRNSISKLQEYNNEIKKSRNYLKAEKNKLQKYLDIAGVIVLVFDANNNVLLINKKGREILGIEASEIIGKDWVSEYVAKKNQIQTKSMLAFLLGNTTAVDTLENIMISKDKSEKNIVWHFSILQNEGDIATAFLATGVDITELTKAKITINQLKEVDQLKNEVLNVATHELKTPLISIVGLSEVMEKQPKTIPSDYQNYISIIHNEGIKLTNLIKTMLTASRNEIGKASAVKEKFDLVDLVSSLKISLEMLAKRTDSKIKFDLRAKEIKIESDKAKISQVIYNFVDNAVKYGPKNQVININLFLLDSKFVRIEVRGDGQGVPKEMQKKLFMKFSQLEPSLSRSQDGMGLGLYICKQNVENLGGQIGVESELNKGATFYFTLSLI